MPVDLAKRVEMLGAALDLLDEGVVVLDPKAIVVFWNEAASALTGHRRMDVLSRPCPMNLYEVKEHARYPGSSEVPLHSLERYSGPAYSGQIYVQKSLADVLPGADSTKAVQVEIRHHLGHKLPAMLRKAELRDALGEALGTALLFHPAEEADAPASSESADAPGLGRSHEELEESLDEAFHYWRTGHVPFGLMWLTIDQAAPMRRTHGRDACEAMIAVVEERLAHGLRATEVMGRWGCDEFLVLSHEKTVELLLDHGDHLAELARTANFRWWGDRISLTASIGAAQAVDGDTLSRLLLTAQQAMHASVYAGGNRVTHGREQTCSQ